MKLYVNRIVTTPSDHPFLVSVSVYFQGCDAHPKCYMCHNPQTWEISEEFLIDYEKVIRCIQQKIEMLFLSYEKIGLVFVGGEPLASHNREWVLRISRFFKESYGHKISTLLYSWRRIIDIEEEGLTEYVDYIDLFVLGRYLHKYRQTSFPASKNQIVIDKKRFQRAINLIRNAREVVV